MIKTMRLIPNPVLLALALLAGCISYQPHEWTRGGRTESRFPMVPPDKLSAVRLEEQAAATEMLKSKEYVRLDDATAPKLAQRVIRKAEGESLYLVRGVSWSEPPLFRRIEFDAAARMLYVDSYTYNGEIFIPGKRVSSASPVIVCLPGDLSAVIPNAIIGGDRILAWSMHKDQVWSDE